MRLAGGEGQGVEELEGGKTHLWVARIGPGTVCSGGAMGVGGSTVT